MQFIETRDGVKLFWTQWGPKAAAPAILFLNSGGMPTQMWDYQMTAFADQGYRCIAYDRRAHGASDAPTDGYNYDTLADDLKDVIEALDLHDLTVIAHSMGGGEIIRYLTRHGSDRVARMILIGATTPFMLQTADNPGGIPEAMCQALRDSWRQDYPKWIDDNTEAFFVPETSPGMRRWLSGMLMSWSARYAIAYNEAITRTDFRAELRDIKVPTLVIHGDRDASAPLELCGRVTARLIPGCRIEVYEGAPHGLLYTHMDRLHADVLKFMRLSKVPLLARHGAGGA